MVAPLPPYLGARAHISLAWLTHTALALLLLAITLSLLLTSIPYLVKDAKQVYTSACNGAESAANVLVSLPHYMADGVNELNAKSVNLVTSGAADVLDFALLSIEEIAIFMIDLYRSLYLCLLDLVVHGSLTLFIEGVQEAEAFVTSAFQDIRTELLASITEINKGLDSSVALIVKLTGVNVNAPQITMPSLAALDNVTIASTLVDSLTSLNSSIPTLSQLRSTLDSIISTPIDLLRTQINATLSNATITVDMLPVPAKTTVALCANLDTSFIDTIGHNLHRTVQISLGVVAVVAVVLFIGYALWERYRYRLFLEGVERAREAWQRDLATAGPGVDDVLQTPHLLSFLAAADHASLFTWLARLAGLFRMGTGNQSSFFWFANYVAHPNALMFLAVGVVSLIGVEIQLWIVEGIVKAQAQKTAQEGAGEFANSLTGSVDAAMNGTSVQFAEATNKIILGLQNGVNNNLLGWVNTTTTAMNSTLVSFYNGITGAITDMFNGTVLEDPALDLVYCIIGSKVSDFETALTYLNQHAHLTLPTVSDSILLLPNSSTADLAASISNLNSSLSTTSVVDDLIDRYASSLRSQRLGFILCIGVWGLVLFMALFGVWWHHYGSAIWARKMGRRHRAEFDVGEKFDLTHLKAFKLSPPPSLNDKPASPPIPTISYPRATETAVAYAFPPTPRAPASPTHRHPNFDQGASWGSLLDFFRPHPSDPTPSSFLPPPPPAPPSGPSSTFHFQAPPFSNPFGVNSSTFRSRARRDSDTIDLPTGGYLHRPLAAGTGRIRGAVAVVASRVRGLKPGGTGVGAEGLSRNESFTSFGETRERRWEHEQEDEGEGEGEDAGGVYQDQRPGEHPPFRQPTLAKSGPRSFIDYCMSSASVAGAHPTQMPISPPPGELGAFPPLVPLQAGPGALGRQPSGYRVGRAPGGNPFGDSNPFEEVGWVPIGSGAGAAAEGRNPFVTPFDGAGEE